MTKLERGLFITLTTIVMIAWATLCAVVANAVDVVQPMKHDMPSEPLQRVPEPTYILEDKHTKEDVHELTEASRGVVDDSELREESETVVEVDEVEYFDIPLDEALQEHIVELCEASGVDVSVVLAMIDKESRFDINAVGDGGRALGLMQIHPRWHGARMNRLECWDLMDPYQNLTVAVDLIAELNARGNGIEWTLMAYNGGEAYADRKVAAGEVSEYASDVLGMAERYLFERNETR